MFVEDLSLECMVKATGVMQAFRKLKSSLSDNSYSTSEPENLTTGEKKLKSKESKSNVADSVSITSVLEISENEKVELKSKMKNFTHSNSSTVGPDILADKKKAEIFFIRNGAILLEKQIASFKGRGGEPIKIYSEEEIYHATNGYDPALIIGNNVATVYKGRLEDRIVAIKTPQGLHDSNEHIDFFLNQVTIKQQISHKNVVQLYGCCLETHIPMLVQEYMNTNMFDHLHSGSACWISWKNRLRIATEIAYALSYMHCAGPKPIVHRNVKSSSIFLDESLSAKLSNFGMSITVNPEETTQTWPLMGTLGYIDPECAETLFVTDKCDVYSFGVVMVELLTGKYPNKMWKQGTDIVTYFLANMTHNFVTDIVDQRLMQEGSVKSTIQQYSELAMKCVQKEGAKRPTMEEVVLKLRHMQQILLNLKDGQESGPTDIENNTCLDSSSHFKFLGRIFTSLTWSWIVDTSIWIKIKQNFQKISNSYTWIHTAVKSYTGSAVTKSK